MSIFWRKTILTFLCTFAVAGSIFLALIHFFRSDSPRIFSRPAPRVIYVHGWMPDHQLSHEGELKLLQSIFPHSKIEVFQWAAQADFNDCLRRADNAAFALAEKIEKLPARERENLILVGHSLGGRIVIRAMALLAPKNKPVLRGIFLAAAIPHDDLDIASAIKNSTAPSVNIFNRQDYILRHLYGVCGEGLKNALGAYGYAFPFQRGQMLQFEDTSQREGIVSADEYMDRLAKHDAVFYLSFLKKHADEIKTGVKNPRFIDNSTARENIERIHVLQDRPNPPMKIVDIGVGWETLDSVSGWRLQRSNTLINGDLYRIVDPLDYQRANGSAEKMQESFNAIKHQQASQ